MKQKMQMKNELFPPYIFLVYFLILLLMSGLHVGIIVGMNALHWSEITQTILPMVYWALVAAGITLFTRREIKKTYEEPLHNLAEAADKVASGDFSVYIPTVHTADHLDYMDEMILDFNKMVEELGSIETLKTDFFSNVSHEFKTPLSAIYHHAQLLQMEGNLDERQRGYVDNILDSSKRMSDLIQNMLKLNKLEKQTIRPVVERYDVCAQLSECAVMFEDSWEKKNIDFAVEMEDRAYVDADPGLMELVWNNLLSNAIKFTPEGGTILLSQRSDEEQVLVSVRDSGCGMTEDVMKHIFDKFYQGDESHAMLGNGLGLALVQRVLELSDARIDVTSKPEEGTEFRVMLAKRKVTDTLPFADE